VRAIYRRFGLRRSRAGRTASGVFLEGDDDRNGTSGAPRHAKAAINRTHSIFLPARAFFLCVLIAF